MRIRGYFVLLLLIPGLASGQDRYYHLLVGTYTSGASEGIYVYKFDTKTGDIVHEHTAGGIENPSFLTASPDGEFVYSVSELADGGGANAFRFDNVTGALNPLNSQSSEGGSACYVSLSPDGNYLFTANYNGGSLAALPVNEDGSLKAASQVIRHEGSSVNQQRQQEPHVHSVVFSPDGKFLFAPDLGTDKVNAYRYQPLNEDRPLVPAEVPFTDAAPGGGPRHLTFSKDGRFAYLVLEMTGEVTAFAYQDGVLTEIQRVAMTAPDFNGASGAAEVRISPDGKFLYASNRGDANELSIYRINPQSGKLTFVGRQSTLGKTPRNFMIGPNGNFLLAANQDSDNIVIFRRDIESGMLTPTGDSITVGNPVYLMMLPFGATPSPRKAGTSR